MSNCRRCGGIGVLCLPGGKVTCPDCEGTGEVCKRNESKKPMEEINNERKERNQHVEIGGRDPDLG
jgi:uncharacterized Zn finger protein (UPF0148 family)